MKRSIKKSTTSLKLRVMIQNATTGAGLTGLTYATSGLTWYYFRDGDTATTAVTLANASAGTWTSGGIVAVDPTNMPGVYELGVPNAALASLGAVEHYLQGAANMVPCLAELEITGWDNQNASNGGMTSIPQAAYNTPGGLPVLNASGGLSVSVSGSVIAIPSASGSATIFNAVPITQEIDAYTAVTLTVPFVANNYNASGWTTTVFTVKNDPTLDNDEAALLTVRVTNGGSGTDGLLVQNGVPASNASLASIVVSTATTTQLAATVSLTASAMLIPPSTNGSYTWELTQWFGAVKVIVGTGAFVVTRSNIRHATTL